MIYDQIVIRTLIDIHVQFIVKLDTNVVSSPRRNQSKWEMVVCPSILILSYPVGSGFIEVNGGIDWICVIVATTTVVPDIDRAIMMLHAYQYMGVNEWR